MNLSAIGSFFARLRHAAQFGFRAVVVALFGLVIPSILCWQAYTAMAAMDTQASRFTFTRLDEVLPATKTVVAPTPLDYTFSALLLMESSNRHIMLSKQRMKMSVMQVGFAVISIGLMFIFLGIEAGGIEGAVESKELAWSGSIKIASTGLATFVIGALMVTAGGVLRNEYVAASVPFYMPAQAENAATKAKSPSTLATDLKSLELCTKLTKDAPDQLCKCLQDAASVSVATH